MSEVNCNYILSEYYDTLADAIRYSGCKEKQNICDAVLDFLLDAFDMKSEEIFLKKAISEIAEINTKLDVELSSADFNKADCAAYLTKSKKIQKLNIERAAQFNADLFVNETMFGALVGNRSASKLWACMNWLGICGTVGKKTAIEIWKTLAVNCDKPVISVLIYAYRSLGMYDEAEKWSTVLRIINRADGCYNAVASGEIGEPQECVELANYAMLVRNISAKSTKCNLVDRAMAAYVLYSRDGFEEKIKALSSPESKFEYLLVSEQNRVVKCGF